MFSIEITSCVNFGTLYLFFSSDLILPRSKGRNWFKFELFHAWKKIERSIKTKMKTNPIQNCRNYNHDPTWELFLKNYYSVTRYWKRRRSKIRKQTLRTDESRPFYESRISSRVVEARVSWQRNPAFVERFHDGPHTQIAPRVLRRRRLIIKPETSVTSAPRRGSG